MSQETQEYDPFSVLDLSPTNDIATVKRAYFAAVKRYPPHADPERFRTVRAAYEALSEPSSLSLWFMRAPVDEVQLAAEYETRYASATEQGCKLAKEGTSVSRAAAFAKGVSPRPLREVLQMVAK
jgi:DnaJ-class molecular chaperone